ncbi:uncharacterized protein LOC100277779 [Zea mays]|uniref:Uncharacterized protein n=1 Tax=Zea mays TaxID=4577 RepID=B6TZV5_MAIZE|nr:uncharacterized protein LOC100277779 [Zea mays]ACG42638.1 hypothetical protein [Zea mays]AQK41270.1 hypothetical protein ZEAMMB73_Zm00001d024471 [Zea mays]AQK41271.1 hypothetical protein ZEAMMB73_Zm00001d024471 [Zea mays]
MAKLAAQLKSKFFGLVGRITSCGRAGATHKDAAGATEAKSSVGSQPVEIRSRGGAPPVDGGAKGHINSDTI